MSVRLHRSWSVLFVVAVSVAALATAPVAHAVSVTASTYATDCALTIPNPDIKGPTMVVSATNATLALQSNTTRAHAQAAATSKIVGASVIKSVTGTSWVDATLPAYDSKGATWSATASGTTLCIEPLPGQPQAMVDFQFQTPDTSQLTLEALGYNFTTPGYHPPTIQGIKRDPLPPGIPTDSFFNIAGTIHVSLHQDGDGVNPPIDVSFLDGGFIINGSGQVTLTGSRPPNIVNQGGSTGVDLSFAPMASPVFQIRSGVPVELTTEISLGMGNGPLGMGLHFPNLVNALGGGISYATQLAKVNDPTNAYTIYAIDSLNSPWTGGGGSWAGTSWSAPTNSINGVADFSRQNITSDATVTLDGTFTAGKLLFGDTVPSHNWTLSPGMPAGSLMLKVTSGTPTIDVANPTVTPLPNSTAQTPAGFVDQTATISAPLGGAQGLTKTGAGTLTLAAQNTYLGPTTAALGGLTLDFGNANAPATNIIPAASALTLGGGQPPIAANPAGATLTVKGNPATSSSQTFASTMLADGYHTVRVNQNGSPFIALNLGPISHAPAGSVVFTLPPTGQVTTSTGNTNGILGGWATVLTQTVSPTTATMDWAANDGSGNIQPYNAYTAVAGAPATIVPNAVSNVKIDNTTTGPVSVTDPAPGVPTDINSLALKDAASRQVNITAGSTLRFGASGGILKSNALDGLNIAINSGNVTAGGAANAAGDLYLSAHGSSSAANNIVITSSVVNNGTGPVRVIKTGIGGAQFSGTNTYTGGTIINAGRLTVSSGAALGTGGVTVLNGGQLSVSGTIANPISLAGNGTAEAGGLGSLRVGGTSTINGTITLDNDARISSSVSTALATLNGKISGAHNLEFGGGSVLGASRTFVLSAANDYTGNTTVSGATLRAGANNVIPSGGGKGNVVLNGIPPSLPATLDLNGFSQTINALISTAGTSNLDFVTGGGSLTVGNGNASGAFAGVISGSLSLTKIGTGTQTLSGANTYSGATTISAGTLTLGNQNVISSASPVVMAAGSTLDTSGFNQSLGSFSVLGPTTLNLGEGMVGQMGTFTFQVSAQWNGTLLIRNWDGLLGGNGMDRIMVGSSAAATLQAIVSQGGQPIQFENFNPGFQILPSGEVVPNSLPFRMADFSRDNQITIDDLKPMLSAFSNLDAFKSSQGLTDQQLLNMGDINHDGVISHVDLQAYLNMIAAAGGGSLASVPEPSTLVLGAIGCAAFIFVSTRSRKHRG